MKIVILDAVVLNPGDLSWDGVISLGDVKIYDRTPVNDEAEIINRIGDAEIVITNKTPITRNIIDNCPNIKFIDVLATGYNCVDVDYARAKGIPVSNVPVYATEFVAQFSIGLILEICNTIGYHSRTVLDGKWQNSLDFSYCDTPLIELNNKTLGIIGFGRIGQAEAKIAKAFGMRIIAYTPHIRDEMKGLADFVSLDELYEQSDIISLHCKLTKDNVCMINKNSISKMKDGVIIINTARGQLINEADLAEALNLGKVYAAGLDVVSVEPISKDNPLLKAKNCYITPHIAWAAKECRVRLMQTTEDNIKAFINGSPINVVN